MAEDVNEIFLVCSGLIILKSLLITIVQLLEDVTLIFSHQDVPLVVDVIPALEKLRDEFCGARDDKENTVSDIVRVACQASIFLIDKYSVFTGENEIYLIAIGVHS